jgi:hypothetical protein
MLLEAPLGWLRDVGEGFHLSGWSDPLHDAALGWSLLVFTGGLAALVRRVAAAWRHQPVASPGLLQVFRLAAALGALGGFMAFLRHPGASYGRSDLTAGGGAALPWVAVLVLERGRRLLDRHHRRP